jgi:hypothetical protein
MPLNQGWRIKSTTPEILITSSASLATGNTLLSVSTDNTPATNSPCWVWGDFVLNLPNGLDAALSVEQPVELYILPEVDGSNFADFDTNFTDVLAPQNLFKGTFLVRAEPTASTAQLLVLTDVLIPPYNFMVGIRNNTGVSLLDGATHFTLAMVRKTFQFI